jgi:threonine/homoserine/homoserine lactone efflux protein
MTAEPMTALSSGLVLGLAAGLSPGPLMTLVVARTLRHGTRDGLLVAAAPLITDAPIILAALLLLDRLAQADAVLAAIGLGGGLFVLYLAWQTFLSAPPAQPSPGAGSGSLARGILVNALSPHPYLFWAGVGAPLLLQAAAADPLAPWLFLGGFYGLLVGSKTGMALLLGRYRSRLNPALYVRVMRALALILLVFGLLLIRDALELVT